MLLWLDITKAFMVPIPRTSSIHGGQQEMLQRWTDNLIFRAGTRTCIGKNVSDTVNDVYPVVRFF